jgi:hypothetical protein
MRRDYLLKSALILAISALSCAAMVQAAADPAVESANTPLLSRGEATDLAVKYFRLEEKNAGFLRDCDAVPEECLFAFSARTDFHDLRFDPVILYPDVYPAYRYYKSINLASKLDLVRGYIQAPESPYLPEQPITRVEALKLIMGASGLLNWKEKFEIAVADSSWLKFSFEGDRWWYSRYLASAAESGVLQTVSGESAETGLDRQEFLEIMKNADTIVASGQTTSLADIYGQTYKKADTSGNPAL